MITDSLGHEIQTDDKVIYNLSGELAYGIIISARITRTVQVSYGCGYIDYYEIKIKHISGGTKPNNGISIVRNPLGIIVLKGLENDNRV